MSEKNTNGVVIEIAEKEIMSGHDLHGKVDIKNTGRFDSIVINSQIEKTSDILN